MLHATDEVELLNQLAIAIQQAQYHNLQTLNTKLKTKVEERTTAPQKSDRRFCTIFNNTFQFTGLLTPDGILLEANQTALSFGGLQLEDVINRPFWEAHWWTISPQTQEELRQAIARAAQGEFIRYEVDVLGANNRVSNNRFFTASASRPDGSSCFVDSRRARYHRTTSRAARMQKS